MYSYNSAYGISSWPMGGQVYYTGLQPVSEHTRLAEGISHVIAQAQQTMHKIGAYLERQFDRTALVHIGKSALASFALNLLFAPELAVIAALVAAAAAVLHCLFEPLLRDVFGRDGFWNRWAVKTVVLGVTEMCCLATFGIGIGIPGALLLNGVLQTLGVIDRSEYVL